METNKVQLKQSENKVEFTFSQYNSKKTNFCSSDHVDSESSASVSEHEMDEDDDHKEYVNCAPIEKYKRFKL
jgi:hypothetical protein